MANNRLFWTPDGYAGFDIHVLRGHTVPTIFGSIQIRDPDDDENLVRWTDTAAFAELLRVQFWKVECVPEFAALAGTNALQTFGLQVGMDGVIQTAPPTTPDMQQLIRSTIVNIRLCSQDPFVNTHIESLRIRINLHDEIRFGWMTPSPLSVRSDSRSVKFTTIAEFRDAGQPTFGDVSRHPIQYTPPPSSPITVDANGYLGVAQGAAVGSQASIGATLSGFLGGGSAGPGVATVQTAWSQMNVAVEPIDGDADEFWERRERTANVLLLPDGFAAADMGDFVKITDGIARQLADSDYAPFNSLKGSLNLFRAWVPPAQSTTFGCNVVSALRPRKDRGSVTADSRWMLALKTSWPDVPTQCGQPPASATIRTADDLLYYFGPPTSADLGQFPASFYDDAEDREKADADAFRAPFLNHIQAQIDRWRARYGTGYQFTISPPASSTGTPRERLGREFHARKQLFEKWFAIRETRLLLERDTQFGISNGERPRLSDEHVGQTRMSWHPFRAQRADVNDMLRNATLRLKDGSLQPLGRIWSERTLPDGTLNRNRRYVLFVCAGLHSGGTFVPEDREPFDPEDRVPVGFATSAAIGAGSGVSRENKGLRIKRAHDVDPSTFPDTSQVYVIDPFVLPVGLLRRSPRFGGIIHEFGHAVAVGDEYGGRGQAPATNTVSDGNLVTEIRARAGNLNNRLLGPTTTPNAALIPWGRWHRIKAAVQLVDLPRPQTAAGPYVGTLRRDHHEVLAKVFEGLDANKKPNVRLLLRRRPINHLSDATDDPTILLRVISFNRDTIQFVPANASDNTAFLGSLPTQNEVRRNGMVLFEPVLSQAGQFLRLMHPRAAAEMNRTDRPLNREIGAVCADNSPAEDDEQVLKVHSADWQDLGAKASQIVGLWDGGDTFDCGVFHPTGYCVMRDSEHRPFCHVCQYLLVDRLDPSRHGAIDSKYAKRYPEPP